MTPLDPHHPKFKMIGEKYEMNHPGIVNRPGSSRRPVHVCPGTRQGGLQADLGQRPSRENEKALEYDQALPAACNQWPAAPRIIHKHVNPQHCAIRP